jgi:hypothetical protein
MSFLFQAFACVELDLFAGNSAQALLHAHVGERLEEQCLGAGEVL